MLIGHMLESRPVAGVCTVNVRYQKPMIMMAGHRAWASEPVRHAPGPATKARREANAKGHGVIFEHRNPSRACGKLPDLRRGGRPDHNATVLEAKEEKAESKGERRGGGGTACEW